MRALLAPFGRRPADDRRRILLDSRTPLNTEMALPIVRAMQADPRISFACTASEAPRQVSAIHAAAPPDCERIDPRRAALVRWDAYLTSDFMWAPLLHRTARIQMFHGVAGKYGFDSPTDSLAPWHRLFFINERRLRNVIAAGALAAGSPAIRLVGMPKLDCLVDGSLQRDAILQGLNLDPSRPTVLYAPTWSPESSLNRLGEDLVTGLGRSHVNVIIKLHDRSLDLRPQYSGGLDWRARLAPRLVPGRVVLWSAPDIVPCLAAADVMVTDHSSAGFEFLLRDRPVVRIDLPELIARSHIHPDYVALLADAATTVTTAAQAVRAVHTALVSPGANSAARRKAASELFYRPGTATERAVHALYEVVELEPLTATAPSGKATACPQPA